MLASASSSYLRPDASPLDLFLLLGPADVLVVELDADGGREAVAVGISAEEADELGPVASTPPRDA